MKKMNRKASVAPKATVSSHAAVLLELYAREHSLERAQKLSLESGEVLWRASKAARAYYAQVAKEFSAEERARRATIKAADKAAWKEQRINQRGYFAPEAVAARRKANLHQVLGMGEYAHFEQDLLAYDKAWEEVKSFLWKAVESEYSSYEESISGIRKASRKLSPLAKGLVLPVLKKISRKILFTKGDESWSILYNNAKALVILNLHHMLYGEETECSLQDIINAYGDAQRLLSLYHKGHDVSSKSQEVFNAYWTLKSNNLLYLIEEVEFLYRATR